ncbi:MAG: Uncharacterized protein K0S95_1005 [Pantoea eucrina]|jgi:hypothetical protein|uniref:hypothetical protein n=1 Tax=Pantoea sp. SIMBA_079 TaxID=3085817 RepID=UPI0026EE9755|nr:Uncharacterized protein [Pantoea eucrina]
MDTIFSLEKIITYLIFTGIAFIVPIVVSERVKRSIGFEYEELLETIKSANVRPLEMEKQSREIRLKSALIAELFAEWTSLSQDRKKLRQLTFEAFLWLPEPLAKELSMILSHDDAALDVRDYIIQVRKFLLGQDDDLDKNKIITFGLSNEERSNMRF